MTPKVPAPEQTHLDMIVMHEDIQSSIILGMYATARSGPDSVVYCLQSKTNRVSTFTSFTAKERQKLCDTFQSVQPPEIIRLLYYK